MTMTAWNRTSVAPMMDRTDRFYRYFFRQLSPRARLYTEMVTAPAIIHGDRPHLLDFDECEHPVALQLGGSDPAQLAQATAIGVEWGYDEVNLNCGCPSDRVQSGQFGACLLAMPELVADCVAAMRDAAEAVPVTVKTRIALDRKTPEELLWPFIDTVAKAGCEVFIIHARPAWLEGLSPKENREIPPLDYEVVAAVAADFPQLTFALNGGLKTEADMARELARFPSVMIGRAAYDDPYLFARFEAAEGHAVPARHEVLEQCLPFIEREVANGVPPRAIIRHMLGLYQGEAGARRWRRDLTEELARSLKAGAADPSVLATRTTALLREATAVIEDARDRAAARQAERQAIAG